MVPSQDNLVVAEARLIETYGYLLGGNPVSFEAAQSFINSLGGYTNEYKAEWKGQRVGIIHCRALVLVWGLPCVGNNQERMAVAEFLFRATNQLVFRRAIDGDVDVLPYDITALDEHLDKAFRAFVPALVQLRLRWSLWPCWLYATAPTADAPEKFTRRCDGYGQYTLAASKIHANKVF
ncbi:hypothetical protein NPX13_g10374 [Xylaria arbuscula]|uniref:Uncharacterized protein n=1 Tax=Xylaria arbuscula TaxID=114810 RepID=A0A9W8N4V9_9PEZI|nr:hypothetical protein NPX13_g10374 [Xylaria arbuscula]